MRPLACDTLLADCWVDHIRVQSLPAEFGFREVRCARLDGARRSWRGVEPAQPPKGGDLEVAAWEEVGLYTREVLPHSSIARATRRQKRRLPVALVLQTRPKARRREGLQVAEDPAGEPPGKPGDLALVGHCC